jgi:prepilin-type N-terminal cleavage/methylation domain-containing protein
MSRYHREPRWGPAGKARAWTASASGPGFTLIEVLVVVAIIGLLMSILLPSLQVARENARYTVCMSNLKQMSVVNRMYLQENRDFYPDATGSDRTTVNDDRFDGKRFYGKYLSGQMKILVCPGDPRMVESRERVSYCMNEFLFQWASVFGYTDPLRMDQRVWRPERVVFLQDYWQENQKYTDWPHFSRFPPEYLNVHNNGSIFLFLDDHVQHYKKLGKPSVTSPVWVRYGITMVPYFLPKP